MNAAAQGDAALASSDIPSAIKHFTQALTELPRAPSYYIKRSTAYSRLRSIDGGPDSSAALRDAEIALQLARERGKRELILLAQMRRGIALYHMERYGDAAFVFEKIQEKIVGGTGSAGTGTGTGTGSNGDRDRSSQIQDVMSRNTTATKKNGYEQELPIWTLKVKGKLNKLDAGDEKAKVTVTEFPANVRVPTEKDLKMQLEALQSGKSEAELVREQSERSEVAEKATAASAPVATLSSSSFAPQCRQTAPVQTTVRHEWYQNNESVVVTLYAKGVQKDSVDVDLKDDSLSVQFPLAGGAEFAFTLDPLYAPIDVSASKVSVMSTKLEISLRKRVPGQKWGALEAPATGVAERNISRVSQAASAAPAAIRPSSVTGSTSTSGPSYPTSSRHGAKDWDKLASKLTEKKKKKKSTGENGPKPPEGKADAGAAGDGDDSDGAESVDSEFGGDPVDAFFKKLYKNADPDTQRAMMKSYVESQGTALSTNWSEVGQGKVEVRPASDD